MEWRPPPSEPRPEPQSAEEISPQLDFLYRAELNFSLWLQFADAKASAVVLLLGLGLLDLSTTAAP